MTEQKRGVLVRVFAGLWNALNFARRLVFNLIFVLLLLAFVGAVMSGVPKLKERTALVLDPKGIIVEQYTVEPTQRAIDNLFGQKVKEVQLRDLSRVIEAAAKDKRIERLILKPDEIAGAGLSSLRELAAAIDNFRQSGKEVIAVSDGMTQGQYLLAAHADQIVLHPEGAVLLEGFGRYRSYYKDMLDWLGVDVHLFRVGEYKSAGEPYVLNHASPEAREADLYWMNSLWTDYLKDIGTARKLDPKQIAADIEDYPNAIRANNGDLAQLALQRKLVDKLAAREEVQQLLIARGIKEDNSFRQIAFKDYLTLLDRETAPDLRPQVAIVVAEGEIIGGEQQPGTVGGESTAKLVRQAREDEHVKAVVLRVNSPGGEVFASELIRAEVELFHKIGKPLIVSMGDVAASGGYWISMNADEIYAEPTTITGSIGIFGLFLNVPSALAKIGIHTDGVGTTPVAGAFDIRRPLDPKVGEMIQAVIDKGYQNFIGKVAQARNKKPEEIDQIGRGRVWSGAQAKDRGLVDQLGGLGDAVAAAAQRANLGDKYQVFYVEKELSAWERFALSLGSNALARVGRAWLPELPRSLLAAPDVRSQLRLLRALDANKLGVFAYCFCEIK